MTWTMAAEITREKINKGIDRAQRAKLTDVDKAKAVMDKYKAQAAAVPTEKNRKLWAWAESVHLGARALAGERIWWA